MIVKLNIEIDEDDYKDIKELYPTKKDLEYYIRDVFLEIAEKVDDLRKDGLLEKIKKEAKELV